jgi:iron complex transport system ATP-binding protein
MTLTIRNLTASYGPVPVLRDVTLAPILPGQFVGLIGPNASGKSTLFKALSGLLRPRGGTIRLGETDLCRLCRRDRARCIAYMPQSYGCNAILTVYESVLLALKQTTGWRVANGNLDRVSDTLAALNLSHLADRGLGNLSGGQAQMVAVAQTLVRDPAIVLLDEPTSALDLRHQLEALALLREIAGVEGHVAMVALHDLSLAARHADRVLLMDRGAVVTDGAPDAVFGDPVCGQTYGVSLLTQTSRRGTLLVDAALP